MKVLTAPHMERCIGCLLCVLEAGRAEKSIALNKAFIRIVAKDGGFAAEVDSGQNPKTGLLERVAEICPRNCLAIVDF